ncbi:uncharacterized protein LOC136096713 [Hydra vulgaris]|uniref:uncharacterized protein LOC136096713 n=1 Tax=Hydra vulgaris TaxID=6087 RepID=UPI0032EA2ED6
MDLDLINKMKVYKLKQYLRIRNLRVSGTKRESVARVFSAMEKIIEPVLTATEVVEKLKDEYQKKTCDPFILLDGWLSEEDSIKQWPMVLYPDIFNYLMFNPSELGSNDFNDYKNSKALSFYNTGWLQKLAYHCINEESRFCAIKVECRHSQRINDTSHKLWLIIEKKNAKIRSCHCTCMAGMTQTCDHVA